VWQNISLPQATRNVCMPNLCIFFLILCVSIVTIVFREVIKRVKIGENGGLTSCNKTKIGNGGTCGKNERRWFPTVGLQVSYKRTPWYGKTKTKMDKWRGSSRLGETGLIYRAFVMMIMMKIIIIIIIKLKYRRHYRKFQFMAKHSHAQLYHRSL